MKTPKEDPKDKEARLRERRIAELERSRSVRTQAKDLTGDIRRQFGNQISMFNIPSRSVGAAGGGQSLKAWTPGVLSVAMRSAGAGKSTPRSSSDR